MAKKPKEREDELVAPNVTQPIIPDPSPELLSDMANESQPRPKQEISAEAADVKRRAAAGDDLSDADIDAYISDPNTKERQRESARIQRQQEQLAELDQQAAMRKESSERLSREDRIRQGTTPTYMAEVGDMIPNEEANLSIPVDGAPDFRRATEQDIRPTSAPQPEMMGPVQPDQPDQPQAAMSRPAEERPDFVGPQEPGSRAMRLQQKRDDKKRVQEILMERARMRRGLPPRNPEARAALESPEAAKNFRQTGSATGAPAPAPGPAGQPATPQASDSAAGMTPAQVSAAGGYQTGQTVQLDRPLTQGATSTTVYALPNGVALPDAQSLSKQDFIDAYKQLNPGKSPIDAITGLARDGGQTTVGRAARQLLKDIGAAGGTPLTNQQKQELEDRLGDEAIDLIQRYSSEASKDISAGSAAIRRVEEKRIRDAEAEQKQRQAEEEKDRTEILRRARQLKSDEEVFTDAEAFERAEREYREEKAFIESGTPIGLKEAETRVLNGEELSRNAPEIMPNDAFQPGVSRDPGSGELVYKSANFTEELPAILVETADGSQIAAPVLTDSDQSRSMPIGIAYVTPEGQFIRPRPVGRPKTTTEEDPTEPVLKFAEVKEELQRSRQKQFDVRFEEVKKTIDQLRTDVAQAEIVMKDHQATKGEAYNQAVENRDVAQKELDRTRNALDEIRKRDVQPVTNEEVRAEMLKRMDEYKSTLTEQEKFDYEIGNPEAVANRIKNALPDVQIYDQADIGKTMILESGGTFVDIPVNIDEYGTIVVHPEDANDMAAIESFAKGFVPLGVPGGSSVSSASHPDNIRAEGLYEELSSMDPMSLNQEDDQVFKDTLSKIQDYIDAKYSSRSLNANERMQIEDALITRFFPSFANLN